MLKKIKGKSSKWVNDLPDFADPFYWQEGYGIFSVSESAVERVRRYIRGQKEHHRRVSFKDELITLLRRHRIPFDGARAVNPRDDRVWGPAASRSCALSEAREESASRIFRNCRPPGCPHSPANPPISNPRRRHSGRWNAVSRTRRSKTFDSPTFDRC